MYIYNAQNKEITTVAWSPDGKRIAVGSSNETAALPANATLVWSIGIWDALTGQHMVHYHGTSYGINHIVWSPNSQRIISQSSDYQQDVVRVLNAATGAVLVTYPKNAYPQDPHGPEFYQYSVAWSPDGKRIASGGKSDTYSLQLWDALTGAQVLTYEQSFNAVNVQSIAWSPDGKYLVGGEVASVGATQQNQSGFLQVWNALTGKSVFLSPPLGDLYSTLQSCSWAPDSQHVVVSLDETALVWDISRPRVLYTYRGHAKDITQVAWSPDGKHVASCSRDKSVQVWDAETGEQTFAYFGHSDVVNCVAWSPDSTYLVSGSADGTAQVWLVDYAPVDLCHPNNESSRWL